MLLGFWNVRKLVLVTLEKVRIRPLIVSTTGRLELPSRITQLANPKCDGSGISLLTFVTAVSHCCFVIGIRHGYCLFGASTSGRRTTWPLTPGRNTWTLASPWLEHDARALCRACRAPRRLVLGPQTLTIKILELVSYRTNKGDKPWAARAQVVAQHVVRGALKAVQWWPLLAISRNCSSSARALWHSITHTAGKHIE